MRPEVGRMVTCLSLYLRESSTNGGHAMMVCKADDGDVVLVLARHWRDDEGHFDFMILTEDGVTGWVWAHCLRVI